MLFIDHSDYIKCSFNKSDNTKQWFNSIGTLDVFYAETKDLIAKYNDLKNFISYNELKRANKFYSDKDRETYVLSHAMLRLVLASRINVDFLNTEFELGLNNKPYLNDNLVYFNLTHAKEAFAFVVSKDFYVGIDIEYINKQVDISSISKSFFSKKEYEYIFRDHIGSKNRFFLLWTRKEALLKAFGIGISENLQQVEVSERENFINVKLFDNLSSDSVSDKHFLYSGNFGNYYLSIAVPNKAEININKLNNESIDLYLK